MVCNIGCQLYGAHRVAVSIKDGVILFHSPTGCNYATLIGFAPSHNHDIRQACTHLVEDDVILGGMRNFLAYFDKAMEKYDYNVMFVITSCVPELINDSLAQPLATAISESIHPNAQKPTIIIEAPGFKGNEWQGTIQTMRQLISLMNPKIVMPATINLIGFFASDYKVDGDLKNIAQMLGEVTINAVFPYDTFYRVLNIPAAQLNVVLRGFEPIGDLLKEQFGTPYIVANYPYGLRQSRAFTENIYKALGIGDFAAIIDQQERTVLQRLGNARRYIELFDRLPVAIVGYPARMYSLVNLLRDELGMNIVAKIDRTDFAQDNLFDTIDQSGAILLLGSDYEASIASKLDMIFMAYDYPVLQRISIAENGYAGFMGYLNFIEDIINPMMEKNILESAK